MTCDTALELLLDAEPSELDGRDATLLGMHLRGCARCGRVAARVVGDTRLLAHAMSAAPVRHVRRRATPVLLPALAAAALVMAVAIRSGREEPLLVATPGIGPAVPVAAAPVDPPEPSAANAPPRPVTRMRRSLPARAFAPAVAVAPVKLETAPVESFSFGPGSSTVAVTPPPGTRATVMQTSNPKFVVVWLH
ncbi:MAG TPA: hypothetical protein VFZ73_08550 [Gemmatimonadaceae bacterium]